DEFCRTRSYRKNIFASRHALAWRAVAPSSIPR
ncbi:hypothetical protein ACVWW4_000001, partial [Bradyrhizobium sp. LB7.1]